MNTADKITIALIIIGLIAFGIIPGMYLGRMGYVKEAEETSIKDDACLFYIPDTVTITGVKITVDALSQFGLYWVYGDSAKLVFTGQWGDEESNGFIQTEFGIYPQKLNPGYYFIVPKPNYSLQLH